MVLFVGPTLFFTVRVTDAMVEMRFEDHEVNLNFSASADAYEVEMEKVQDVVELDYLGGV